MGSIVQKTRVGACEVIEDEKRSRGNDFPWENCHIMSSPNMTREISGDIELRGSRKFLQGNSNLRNLKTLSVYVFVVKKISFLVWLCMI